MNTATGIIESSNNTKVRLPTSRMPLLPVSLHVALMETFQFGVSECHVTLPVHEVQEVEPRYLLKAMMMLEFGSV